MKNKTQHTPGPWVMDIEKLTTGHWNYKIVTEIKPLGNYPLHICTLNKFKDETHLKNAHLIAAAPEMFEALELIGTIANVTNGLSEPDYKNRMIRISELVTDILNKAKGE